MRRILFAAPFFTATLAPTEFVGGCDIMRRTYLSGELRQIHATRNA